MSTQIGPTIGSLSLRPLRRYPSRIAFKWDGGSMSYAQTHALIGHMQAVFMAAGARPGICVAVLGANRAEVWCAGVAAQICGMAITWLHPAGSYDDQYDQLTDSEAVFFVIDAETFHDRGGELSQGGEWGGQTFTLGRASYGVDLLAESTSVNAPRDLADPNDIAILNYTGGTTGKSKGAVRRHGPLSTSTTTLLADFELPAVPVFLAIGPISHVTGSKILPTLLRGGCVHMVRKFDPNEVCRIIARERINASLMVPTMIYSILDCEAIKDTDFSSLELLLYGASPMSPTRLSEGLERIGPVFAQLYGQTECYPIAQMPRHDHDPAHPERFAAAGFAVSSCQVQLQLTDGSVAGPGEAGEICVRSPYSMDGYWKRPAQTAEAMKDGWLHTGDIARMDEQGRLYIVDRTKDMIITGGFNVYPRGVEDVLTAHEGVAMAAVFGTPDPKWGEAVTAHVVARPGAALSKEALIASVKLALGSVHAPKHVEFVESLPLTPLGKVDKKALRAIFWAGQDRMVS